MSEMIGMIGENGISEIIAALVGGMLVIIADIFINLYRYRKEEKSNIRLVYYDLMSIEKYVKEEIGLNESAPKQDIRFNGSWQEALKDISFFKNKEISLIYDIYDAIYDYNKLFKEDSPSKKQIRKVSIPDLINSEDFADIKQRMVKKIKLKQ